jgi:site-specific DNA-methyltransferase (adenine-specific)
MDPFVGLGSTAVACARLGVSFVGSDLDETYLAEAVSRTREAVLERATSDKRPVRAVRTRRGELKTRKATAS